MNLDEQTPGRADKIRNIADKVDPPLLVPLSAIGLCALGGLVYLTLTSGLTALKNKTQELISGNKNQTSEQDNLSSTSSTPDTNKDLPSNLGGPSNIEKPQTIDELEAAGNKCEIIEQIGTDQDGNPKYSTISYEIEELKIKGEINDVTPITVVVTSNYGLENLHSQPNVYTMEGRDQNIHFIKAWELLSGVCYLPGLR